jgi:short-subunit dehydrogenase
MNFTNKVVWITGASSGIGEALAVAFAQKGAKLVLSARRKEELERVKLMLKISDDQVLVLPMDVTDFGKAELLTQQVIAHFGQIDYMVHNAGISQRGAVQGTSLDVYQRLMDVNFFSTVALTKAILPFMQAQKSGHFVVISSVAGKVGTLMRSGYNASKHALHGFYDSLRAEMYDDNIQVLLVCPGYIRTNISVNALNEKGEPTGKMDNAQAQGIAVEECATRIVTAVENKKKEIVIGGLKETAAVYLKRFWPNLLHDLVRKSPPS